MSASAELLAADTGLWPSLTAHPFAVAAEPSPTGAARASRRVVRFELCSRDAVHRAESW